MRSQTRNDYQEFDRITATSPLKIPESKEKLLLSILQLAFIGFSDINESGKIMLKFEPFLHKSLDMEVSEEQRVKERITNNFFLKNLNRQKI